MKVKILSIYPFRTRHKIYYSNGNVERTYDFENTKKAVCEARKNGENVELIETKFLAKESKLVRLLR